MSGGVTRFLGGPPGRVVFQLIAMSLLVGLILSLLGVSPYDIVNGLQRLVQRIYDMGFGTIEWLFRYILLGAVIVVPVWLIMRIARMGRGGQN